MKNKFKKISVLFLSTFCLMYTLLFTNTAYASTTETTVKPTEAASQESIQHIYDDADLLSTTQVNDLEEMCTQYSAEAGIEIIILSHNNAAAPDAAIYIEDFYDKMLYGDSVILLVDMYNRDICLEGYGLAETYIHSKRGDVIISDISPYLTGEDYVTAFEMFISSSAAYMKDDSELNYDYDYSYDSPLSSDTNYSNSGYDDYRPNNTSNNANSAESILTNGFFQLIISLIIGGIAVGIMVYNSGGKMTAGGNTYLEGNNSGLIGRRDDYIRTTVTRIRKPTQNNNGRGGFNAGGFGGGMSGGGHSHSTSRGKF